MMNCQTILIVKTSAIGDVIQTFPVLEYLRKKFPEARIDWVVEKAIAPLLSAHPMVSNVIPIDSKNLKYTRSYAQHLRRLEYDLLFDLQGNIKSGIVTACARAKIKVGFDWHGVREKPNLLATNVCYALSKNLPARDKYLALLQRHFQDEIAFEPTGVALKLTPEEEKRANEILLEKKERYMVCFGSKWKNKQLDPLTLRLFLQRIYELNKPSFLFIYASAEEKKIAEDLSSQFPQSEPIGDLSLPLWQALMRGVDRVIAVDSAALHLCGTTTTPSFSFFGPTQALVYKPLEARHRHIQGACPYQKQFTRICPALRTCKTGACLKSLKEEDLFAAFQDK